MTIQRASIAAIGLNCETTSVDLRVSFSMEDDERDDDAGHRFVKIEPSENVDQALVEADDENGYFHDAPALERIHAPLLKAARALLLDAGAMSFSPDHNGKVTTANAICFEPDSGIVSLRLGLVTLVNGVERKRTWHRTTIEPGGDVPIGYSGTIVDFMIAAVNADITTRPTLRAKPVSSERIQFVKSICDLVHTPNVVKTYRERVAKQSEVKSARASVSRGK